MAPWSCRFVKPDRIFTRPLGVSELIYYWYAVFSGTSDTLQHIVVKTLDEDGPSLFSKPNVSRTWSILKRRFPLLAAQVDERGTAGYGDVHFVVSEKRVNEISPEEISFSSVASVERAREFASNLLRGPRQLSFDLLARVYVLREDGNPKIYHIIIHGVHAITDGAANLTILRMFLDTLASVERSVDDTPDLAERLAMVVAAEDRSPSLSSFGIARQRWRWAIAKVLLTNKMSKMQGGHTLPWTFSERTLFTPCQSSNTIFTFPKETSALIVANCRRNNVTFGHALPVLGQVALARVLYRHYLSGKISEAEWEYRKREPMHTGGPLNLRPYLDQDWYQRGGAGEVCVCISYFYYTLPFMPLGLMSQSSMMNSTPSYADLLSVPRFFLRCRMVKKQAYATMKHPLFLEMATLRAGNRLESVKPYTLRWRDAQRGGESLDREDSPLPTGGFILAHGGSSFGIMDSFVPLDYPLAPSEPLSPLSPAPHPLKAAGFYPPTVMPSLPSHGNRVKKLHIESFITYLRGRPAELYLGSATVRQHLRINVFWDSNVYDDELVKEWLGEVASAALFYLGQADAATGTEEQLSKL